MPASGFVLTGGLSRRMGRDKAILAYRGSTLVETVAAEVRAAAGNVTLVGAPGRYRHLGLPVLDERYPGAGPLSGIEAALRHATEPWSLVVACDIANLRAAWLEDLLALTGRNPEAAAIVPVEPDGRVQPLCAAYHVRALPAVQAALEAGKLKLISMLEEIVTIRAALPWAAAARNINTPEDWSALLTP